MTSKCSYSGCKFNCQSPYHHRARYAYIGRRYRRSVNRVNMNPGKYGISKTGWNNLKKVGVVYNITDENVIEERVIEERVIEERVIEERVID